MARYALIFATLLLATTAHAQRIDRFELTAPEIDNETVAIEVYLPPGYDKSRRYPVLYINDGQDMPAVHLPTRLKDYYASASAKPLIVVAVPLFKDRMGVYGLADRTGKKAQIAPTKYGNVGAKSYAYNEWFTGTLIPTVDQRYSTERTPQGRAVLGWSLGAVAAFSLGWQYDELIGNVGMFSPSLWLSSDENQREQTRLVQSRIENDAKLPVSRIYLAVGTQEDTDDRDGDGVNDAVDDVFDATKALQRRQIPHEAALLVGGKHNQAAWSEMLPRFMRWLTSRDVK